MDHDRLGLRCARGGATGRALGGDAFTLDQEDGLVGLAVVLGAVNMPKPAWRKWRREASAITTY
jgi:hypothetical protein